MRSGSVFFAWNLRLLWLTEPFPTSPLIVLFIIILPFFPPCGSVTLVKSNAKALLTAAPSKMQPVPGFALSEGQRVAFEKALSVLSAKLICVTVRVDGDGV